MKSKIAGLCLASAILSGCATQTFSINGNTANQPTIQESQTFFISGLGQEHTTDAATVCGGVDKVIKVEAQQTFVNGFFALVTFGIYTPRDIKVYCRA